MAYTVNKLAKLAGISIRTLHYYDSIGLLKPSINKDNGYRQYGEKELSRLQQILFFKELEFTLEEIKNILDAPSYNPLAALKEQKKLLTFEKNRLIQVINTINKTINHMTSKTKINDNDLYGGLTKKQMEEYKDEARQRWGNTEAFKQSEARTKHWTKADYDRIGREQDELMQAFVKAIGEGVDSPEVQVLVKQHHEGINRFYDCSYEMYRGLANLYIEDPRFTAFYEKYKKGLAQLMHDAIYYYCDMHEKNA